MFGLTCGWRRRLPNSFPERNSPTPIAPPRPPPSARVCNICPCWRRRASAVPSARVRRRRRKRAHRGTTVSPNAAADAFVAVERATKEVEDERERAGLERIDAVDARRRRICGLTPRGGDRTVCSSASIVVSIVVSIVLQRSSSQRSSERSSDSESSHRRRTRTTRVIFARPGSKSAR